MSFLASFQYHKKFSNSVFSFLGAIYRLLEILFYKSNYYIYNIYIIYIVNFNLLFLGAQNKTEY